MEKLMTVKDWKNLHDGTQKTLTENANDGLRKCRYVDEAEEDSDFYTEMKLDHWPTEEEIKQFYRKARRAGWTQVGARIQKGKPYLTLYYPDEQMEITSSQS